MDDALARDDGNARAPTTTTRSDHHPAREKPKNRFVKKKKEVVRPPLNVFSRISLSSLCGGHFQKPNGHIFPTHQKRREEPTPYALAAAVTADESGAIDPGDNPVAFFTQLSDAFLFEPPPLPEDILTYVASLFFFCFFDAFFRGRFCRRPKSNRLKPTKIPLVVRFSSSLFKRVVYFQSTRLMLLEISKSRRSHARLRE